MHLLVLDPAFFDLYKLTEVPDHRWRNRGSGVHGLKGMDALGFDDLDWDPGDCSLPLLRRMLAIRLMKL